ncbi:polysaccharide biosynthesis tyrosine autokinase [Chitinophaga sp. G-6-1-13]|uniref:non-specific protein-tyrosine kinase n=1 Tax=Chitinophaga fulva TaxID=2728842 RepID=A0A848GMS7_9BACT|nr:polysaccharide biosynthesis tyrosine autokinase [Chitinophaga fulva]NML37258.1 polysaccharide biosynthesis tyrosine autokinase [Chitinophaga fulva]
MDTNFNIKKTGGEDFFFRNILESFIHHWYWFVISVVLALAAAYVCILITPAAYRLSAIILIDDNASAVNALPIGQAANFVGNNSLMKTTSAEKEIYILKSRRLARQVVADLHLNISYFKKEKLKLVDMYLASPVRIEFLNDRYHSATFTIKPAQAGKYTISGLKMQSDHSDFSITAAFGDTVITPFGKCKLNRKATKFSEPITVAVTTIEEAANSYNSRIEAKIDDEKSGAINLSLVDNNYQKAADVINKVIAVYNDYIIKDKNQQAESTALFIKERLKIIAVELGDVDGEIEQYKKTNHLTDVVSEAAMYLATSSDYQSQYIGTATQLNLVNFMDDFLTNPKNNEQLLPVNTGITDSGLETLMVAYNEVLLKRNRLLDNSSIKSPVVQSLDSGLASIKKTMLFSIDNIRNALRIKLRDINEQQGSTAKQIGEVPTQEKEVQSISRQKKVKEELYLYLLQKREENEMNLATAMPNARVVDYAEGTLAPVSPDKFRILFIALLLGLVLPAIVIYLLQLFGSSVHNKKDIESYVTIPLSGEIPQGKKTPGYPVAVKEESRDAVSESFRIIRTNLLFMLPSSSEGRVMMITSTHSGEGKTFVSINLALSFALTNKRVILVNADIRKSSAGNSFFNNTGKGLTDYLSGHETDIQSIIKKEVLHPALDVIDSGRIPPNPAELLLSERLEVLMATLRKSYDYIILDNVPMGLVADAVIVNRVADLTIYIIRAGKLDRRLLPQIEKSYQHKKFKNMTVILNGYNAGKEFYRYGYGYGYLTQN